MLLRVNIGTREGNLDLMKLMGLIRLVGWLKSLLEIIKVGEEEEVITNEQPLPFLLYHQAS